MKLARIASIVALIALFFEPLFAQKRAVDFSTGADWPVIGRKAISNDGKYVAGSTTVAFRKESVLIVLANGGSWKKDIAGATSCDFTSDNRKMIFRNSHDSVGILELGTDNIRYISRVGEFKMVGDGNEQWLVCKMNDSEKTLFLLNLINGTERRLSHIEQYCSNDEGSILIVEEVIEKDSLHPAKVQRVNLSDGSVQTICHAYDAGQYRFDEGGKRIVFFSKDVADERSGNIRYHQPDMDSSSIIIDIHTPGMNGEIVAGSPFFGNKGDRVFFTMASPSVKEVPMATNKVKVTIKGPQNDCLQYKLSKNTTPMGVIGLKDAARMVIRLQEETDDYVITCKANSDWVVAVSNVVGNRNDYKWRVSTKPNVYVVAAQDGARRLLRKNVLCDNLNFSLSGKYVIWFDRENGQWFSYNIKHNKTKNISGEVPEILEMENFHGDFDFPASAALAGWLENDQAVLIYGKKDIWQLDPDGVKPPINVTGFYGERNNIVFRYTEASKTFVRPLQIGDTLLLSAFDRDNQDDGFFQLILGGNSLKKVIMSHDCYSFCGPSLNGYKNPGYIMKANNANVYMLARMNANQYPNLFVTSDFTHLTPITDLHPQQVYNWYTTEFVHWTLFDGKLEGGVLYKPENFDPRKKYPLIFYYYEYNVWGLHSFVYPALADGPINIPWFVSNGYLVFVPAIHYKKGYPGRSAYNSVVSAAQYLSKKPWVDGKHMGLQAHSFGGFETNYIVSHTSLFAAAASSAGVSNNTSSYLQGWEWDGTSYYEMQQGRIGQTLWQAPELYIENSPVFRADKVTTPLLIISNKNDGQVFYTQGAEWYNALHRLQKKVWMLSYVGEGHIIDDPANQLDYSIRLGQFFDHYLKGKPAPKWMTKGSLPGVNDTNNSDPYALDVSGAKP